MAHATVPPPVLVAPAAREVSFGRVAGRVAPGTRTLIVKVNGRVRAVEPLPGVRFSFTIALPRHDVTVRVVAVGPNGGRATRSVGPVFGFPGRAAVARVGSYEDRALARRVRRLVRSFPGISAVYVQDLRTGAGAAWNARGRFPAASTLKLAIAIEVMRVLDGPPTPGSSLDRLLRDMLELSDNAAANSLLVWLGGSTSAGAARVNWTMRALGLRDSEMFGGYVIGTADGRPPIPLRAESAIAFLGKYTTAWDLARLHRFVHLAALGRGALLRLRGAFTPSDGRFLLFALVHSADRGKLDRFVGTRPDVAVPHKAGWISTARHDSGLVYGKGGVFVAAVMTWNGSGAGEASDILAGRVAQAGLERFRALRRAPAGLVAATGFRL